MEREDVLNQLADIIDSSDYIDIIVFEEFEDGSKNIMEVDTFLDIFEECELTYDSLMTHEFATYYKKYFDDWKAKGYI